ncbi:hypothetical protein Scep_000660 [Stephania cephalantha]|uniref:Uncharacterized protein n=1 Tax=Stephania cephalantha TaxID=152367 RepID=A0AAP0LA94_9MAGN
MPNLSFILQSQRLRVGEASEMARYSDERRRTARDGLGCGEGTRGGLRRLQSPADGDGRTDGLVAASIAATADLGERERERVDGEFWVWEWLEGASRLEEREEMLRVVRGASARRLPFKRLNGGCASQLVGFLLGHWKMWSRLSGRRKLEDMDVLKIRADEVVFMADLTKRAYHGARQRYEAAVHAAAVRAVEGDDDGVGFGGGGEKGSEEDEGGGAAAVRHVTPRRPTRRW